MIYSQNIKLREYHSSLLRDTKNDSLVQKNDGAILGKSDEKVKTYGTSSSTLQVANIISQNTDRVNGQVSVYYKNLASEETILVNGKDEYYMASLYKLIVTLFVLQHEVEGKLRFTDLVGSPAIPVEQALERIITESNNEYAQAIVSKYTWATIERSMRSRLGIPFSVNSNLVTNVFSIGSLFSSVSQSISTTDAESKYLLALMNKQQRTHKLPKYLPKHIYSHNKTGEFEEFSHDGAIFYTPKANYVLVFMSKTTSPGSTDEVMARMSLEIYEVLNK